MAIDDDFMNDLQEERAKVNAKYSGKRGLSEEEIKGICPMPVDRKHLDGVISIVNTCSNDNEAKAQLMEHMKTGGEVVVRLLRTFLVG